jgi:catechol 2,3-dioxygenase
MTGDVIQPTFHHVSLKTARLQEMIDFYATLVGAEVTHQDGVGAWLTNDRANHRIALLASPVLSGDSARERQTGLHHIAYEYAGLAELNATYLRLMEAGIEPVFCLDHGIALSYYYADPDGNHVELQMDAFGDWAWSKAWMKNSKDFKTGTIGQLVDPAAVADDHAAGIPFEEIHAKAMRGAYAPQQAARRPFAAGGMRTRRFDEAAA